MSENYFICCQHCYERLKNRSAKAAKFWLAFCEHRMEFGEVIHIKNKESPELRTLEMMGFIITTDQKNGTAVKVLGHMQSEENEHFFCVKEGCHE